MQIHLQAWHGNINIGGGRNDGDIGHFIRHTPSGLTILESRRQFEFETLILEMIVPSFSLLSSERRMAIEFEGVGKEGGKGGKKKRTQPDRLAWLIRNNSPNQYQNPPSNQSPFSKERTSMNEIKQISIPAQKPESARRFCW